MHRWFTEEELFELYRRVAPEDQARVMARASASPVTSEGHVTDFTLDTLVLFSLQSDEARQRAERYLTGGHAMEPDVKETWERRRAELKPWVDAGYPLLE